MFPCCILLKFANRFKCWRENRGNMYLYSWSDFRLLFSITKLGKNCFACAQWPKGSHLSNIELLELCRPSLAQVLVCFVNKQPWAILWKQKQEQLMVLVMSITSQCCHLTLTVCIEVIQKHPSQKKLKKEKILI